MGLFSSKSSSKSNATATEQGQQVEDQGNAFNFAGVVSGKKNQAHINVSTSDFGAISGALDAVDDVLELADESTSSALEFGAGAFVKAIDSADESREQALEFSAGAFSSALGAASAANASAMAASNDSRRDALEFGAGTFTAALNAVDESAEQAITTAAASYNASAGQISHFAQTAIDKVSDATKSEASESINLIIKLVAGVLALGVIGYGISKVKK